MIAARAPSLDERRAAPLRAMADGWGIPGLCVAMTGPIGDAILVHGDDAAGSGRAVTRQTWFQAASSGKHVTAAVILDLIAAGRIDPTAPIGNLLGNLPPAWGDRTVAGLLHHVSGLPEYLPHGPDAVIPTTRDAFLTLAATLEPLTPEGAAWMYSNTNYILLGLIAQAVTGRPCGALVDDLFARLGVVGARAASPQWARDANAGRVDGAAPDDDSVARDIFGDGDIAFTAEGALAWLKCLLTGDVPGSRGPAAMFAPYRPDSPGSAYGCGWFLERLGDANLAHHAGHYDGWTAMALLNRTRGSGVLALCNLAPRSTRAIRAIALRALEDFAAGATPLALHPIADASPTLTASARRNLIRADDRIDHGAFSSALAGDGRRPLINLWSGVAPDTFGLVEDDKASPRRTRRYRLTYKDRVEHLTVETDEQDRITWAWPL